MSVTSLGLEQGIPIFNPIGFVLDNYVTDVQWWQGKPKLITFEIKQLVI